MNACIDCVHSRVCYSSVSCAKFTKPNPVFGGEIKTLCSIARSRKDLCDIEGKYFEPIPAPEKVSVFERIKRIFR